MKKFSKIYESSEAEKIYQVKADLSLEIRAENEGEAGYLADSVLGGIKEHIDFTIQNIEEVMESQLVSESVESPSWATIGDYLQRNFEFSSFSEAFNFVQKVANLAEQEDHHPIILHNVNEVNLRLKTHDAGEITEKDHQMAKKIDDLV